MRNNDRILSVTGGYCKAPGPASYGVPVIAELQKLLRILRFDSNSIPYISVLLPNHCYEQDLSRV